MSIYCIWLPFRQWRRRFCIAITHCWMCFVRRCRHIFRGGFEFEEIDSESLMDTVCSKYNTERTKKGAGQMMAEE
jgi:hypothetical protein